MLGPNDKSELNFEMKQLPGEGSMILFKTLGICVVIPLLELAIVSILASPSAPGISNSLGSTGSLDSSVSLH